MVLSKREKLIAICVAVLVALAIAYWTVVVPYYAQLDDLDATAKHLKSTQDSNKLLFVKQTRLQPVWQAMLDTGLESDFSIAQSRTQQALQTWARDAGVNLDALSSDRAPTQQGDFQVINFSLDFSAGGPQAMRGITRLLGALETAEIPIRVNDMKMTSAKEGSDQLNVKLVVSALYMPGTDSSGHPLNSGSDGGEMQ